MNRILAIAVRCMAIDQDSKQFVMDNVYSMAYKFFSPVITRLIALKRIEHIDVKAFTDIVIHYYLGVASLAATDMRINVLNWRRGFEYLIASFIRLIGEEKNDSL